MQRNNRRGSEIKRGFPLEGITCFRCTKEGKVQSQPQLYGTTDLFARKTPKGPMPDWLALLVISGLGKVRKKIYVDEYLQIASYVRQKERMKQMATSLLDHNTVTVPLQDVVRARPIAASPAKKSRSVTASLAFLIGCVTLMMTGFAVIIPVFPQRLQALGLGPETLALMEGAFGLGMFLFSTPMGTWSGRIGRKPILFISLAGFIVTNLLLAFVNVPLLFIPIRFVEGMLLSGLIPVAMSMVGDTIPLSKQGRWIGFLTTAQAVGFALGPGLGGLLSQTLGFTSPFLLSAGIALAASLLAIFMVPETLPEHVRAEARPQKANRRALANKPKEWH